MSLSRKQAENNYWPSISDMFLVFFVLTLALASNLISGQQEGEKYIMEDVVKEARILIENYNKLYPEQKATLPPMMESGDNDYPDGAKTVLSDSLGKVYERIKKVCKKDENDAEKIKAVKDKEDKTYREYVRLISYQLDLDYPESHFDTQLRRINEKWPTKTDGDNGTGPTMEDLQAEITVLKLRLGKINEIADEILEILKLNPQPDESIESKLERAKEKIDELQTRVGILGNGIGRIKEELAECHKRLNSLLKSLGVNNPDAIPTIGGKFDRVSGELVEWLNKILKAQGVEAPEKITGFRQKLESIEAKAKESRKKTENEKIYQAALDENTVLFETGKTEPLIQKDKKQKYDALVKNLEERLIAYALDSKNRFDVQIVGHADGKVGDLTASEEDDKKKDLKNLPLSMYRAERFGEMLKSDVTKQLEDDMKFKTMSWSTQNDVREYWRNLKFINYSAGHHCPLPNTNRDGEESRNRRIEIMIIPQDLINK